MPNLITNWIRLFYWQAGEKGETILVSNLEKPDPGCFTKWPAIIEINIFKKRKRINFSISDEVLKTRFLYQLRLFLSRIAALWGDKKTKSDARRCF